MNISAKEEYGLRAIAELAEQYGCGAIPLSLNRYVGDRLYQRRCGRMAAQGSGRRSR